MRESSGHRNREMNTHAAMKLPRYRVSGGAGRISALAAAVGSVLRYILLILKRCAAFEVKMPALRVRANSCDALAFRWVLGAALAVLVPGTRRSQRNDVASRLTAGWRWSQQ